MKKTKILLMSSLLLTSLICLSSCNKIFNFNLESNDFHRNFKKLQHSFTNLSDEYVTSDNSFIDTYYLEDSNVPYINITQYLHALDGVYDTSYLNFELDTKKNNYKIFWSYKGEDFQYSLDIDYKKNIITVNDLSFFDITKETSSTNYSYGIKYKDVDSYIAGKKVEFDLGKYGFDIYFNKEENVLIPFYVCNTLFGSTNYYNVYFNGKDYYGSFFDLDSAFDSSIDPKLISIREKNPYFNTLAPKDIREATYNHLNFVLDYFYGLKDYKGIDTFKDNKEYFNYNIEHSIKSSKYIENLKGYYELIYGKLDELHTSFNSYGFFRGVKDPKELDNLGGFINETYRRFYTSYIDLNKDYKELGLSGDDKIVRFNKDLAIINLTSFKTGKTEDIFYDTVNYEIKPNAYKYDTYCYLRKAFDIIDNHSSPIKKVVIDLSRNTGGNVAAMYRSLGFLTDKNIEISHNNSLSHESFTQYLALDTNLDGNFDDLDSYENKYKFYVLSSPSTFSAANSFTSIAKHMGIAKILGQRSGGGMCSVLPVVLGDGSTIQISSYNQEVLRKKKLLNDELLPVEGGMSPDIDIPLNKFYNADYIYNLLP